MANHKPAALSHLEILRFELFNYIFLDDNLCAYWQVFPKLVTLTYGNPFPNAEMIRITCSIPLHHLASVLTISIQIFLWNHKIFTQKMTNLVTMIKLNCNIEYIHGVGSDKWHASPLQVNHMYTLV